MGSYADRQAELRRKFEEKEKARLAKMSPPKPEVAADDASLWREMTIKDLNTRQKILLDVNAEKAGVTKEEYFENAKRKNPNYYRVRKDGGFTPALKAYVEKDREKQAVIDAEQKKFRAMAKQEEARKNALRKTPEGRIQIKRELEAKLAEQERRDLFKQDAIMEKARVNAEERTGVAPGRSMSDEDYAKFKKVAESDGVRAESVGGSGGFAGGNKRGMGFKGVEQPLMKGARILGKLRSIFDPMNFVADIAADAYKAKLGTDPIDDIVYNGRTAEQRSIDESNRRYKNSQEIDSTIAAKKQNDVDAYNRKQLLRMKNQHEKAQGLPLSMYEE